jgi:VWFA-related protein
MIRRAILPVLWCAAALAQLPPPQSEPPKPDEPHNRKTTTPERDLLHVDARVTDFQGRAAPGLTAADFTIEVNGKPRKIDECRFVEPRPVRVALLIDDLSLSLPHLNAVRAAVRKAVDEMPPGHEFAIARTSGGEGALEQFTSDRAMLAAALDQVAYNPLQADSSPKPFQVGTLGALQAVLDGLRVIPGRKAVLIFSERLRDPQRVRGAPREVSLKPAANRGSAVVYAFDAAASNEQVVMLDEGIASLAEDTGGKMFERGVDPSQALAQVLRDQSGYYALTFTFEGLIVYVSGMPDFDRLVVKSRKEMVVRARKGVMGGSSDTDAPVLAPGTEPAFALTAAFAGSGIRIRLTPLAGIESPSSLDAVVHIDAHDVALTKGFDGFYHGELQLTAEIFANTSMGVQRTATGVNIRLNETALREVLDRGFDCKLTMTVPLPGIYQLRVAVADTHSSRIGSASQAVQIPEWNGGRLTISSIVLRDVAAKPAPDKPAVKYLDENASDRVFPPGFRIPYHYLLYNLHRNQDKHAQIEVRSQLCRDGVPVYTSDAKLIEMDLPAPAKPAAGGGFIALTPQTLPGRYTLLLTVADKLAPGPAASVTQTVDFQVRR